MGKKQSGSIPNKAIYSRLSYLYQAAACLRSQGVSETAEQPQPSQTGRGQPHSETREETHELCGDIHAITSRRLLSDLRAASLKTQIRLDPAVKRTVCKYCDTLLVEGVSCHSSVENKSKGAKKPWADVLVLRCRTCGGEKRFPVSAARQKRRPFRDGKHQGEAKGAPHKVPLRSGNGNPDGD